MAIRATQISSLGTIEQLRNQFNNLVTDVTGLESGTLNFDTISAANLSVADLSVTGQFTFNNIDANTLSLNGSSIVFEGATDDAFETTLFVTDPTADRTITFKDATGTVAFVTDLGFATSTLTEVPGSGGNTDLAGGETPFELVVDAFGIAIGDVYDNNEPKGLIQTTDLGSNTGI